MITKPVGREPTGEERFVLAKATCRALLAQRVNSLLDHWRTLPERQEELQDALVATLADLTAECATGVREPTKEQFLDFMGRSYDYAMRKRRGEP